MSHPNESSQYEGLDLAASAVSAVLVANQIPHGFIGGYAVSLLGGGRTTKDLDILVSGPAIYVRRLLLESDSRFFSSKAKTLLFRTGISTDTASNIPIQILQGGDSAPLKLPDISKAGVRKVKPSDIHQNRLNYELLILTKIKRWMFVAESTRPQSQTKASSDCHDMTILLRWLVERDLTIDFCAYPQKQKEDFIPGIQLLFRLRGDLEDLLEKAMILEDFQTLREELEMVIMSNGYCHTVQ